MSRRRLFIFSFLSITVLFLIFTLVQYVNSFNTVRIIFKQPSTESVTVRIYNLSDHESSVEDYKDKTPLKETNSNIDLRLKNGEYVVVTPAGTVYEPQVQEFSVDSTRKDVVISPRYNSQNLESQLNKQRSDIRSMLYAQYEFLNPKKRLYTFLDEKLHLQGEWYTATVRELIPGRNKSDIYRLVAQKEGDKWILITTPPDLIISNVRYPDIPREVLLDLNRRQSIADLQ